MLENGGCRSGLLLSAEGRLQTLLISSFFLLRKKRNKAFDVAAMVNRWTLKVPPSPFFGFLFCQWNRRWIDELFKKSHLYFPLRWRCLAKGRRGRGRVSTALLRSSSALLRSF
ncbi:hypothetical protein TB1_044417 [Malus domestica]